MANPHDDTPSFWNSETSIPKPRNLPVQAPDNETKFNAEPGPGLSIGAIILGLLSLPSSLLLPPFAALLAIAGTVLSGIQIKRSSRRPKLAIGAVSFCIASLVLAIGMTFYASWPAPRKAREGRRCG